MTCCFNVNGDKCNQMPDFGSNMCKRHNDYVVDQYRKFTEYIKSLEIQVDSLKSQVINLQKKNLDVNEYENEILKLKNIIQKINDNNTVNNQKIRELFKSSRKELIDYFEVEINKLKVIIKRQNTQLAKK